MKYEAILKDIPEHIIYYKEYSICDYNYFFDVPKGINLLQKLSDKVMEENPEINLTDPDYNYILYLDGKYQAKDIHVAFCDAVTGFGKDTEEYKFRRVERILAVSVEHRGPYHKLGEAYAFAYKWIKENGYKAVGCPRDSTIDGCWNRADEEDYITEIQIPVEKNNACLLSQIL